MNRKKCFLMSAVTFAIAVVMYGFNYLMFHYLTAELKFTSEFHKTAQKPFITNLVGDFATLVFFASVMLLVVGFIVFEKEKKEN